MYQKKFVFIVVKTWRDTHKKKYSSKTQRNVVPRPSGNLGETTIAVRLALIYNLQGVWT